MDNLKILILKNDKILITEIKELTSELGEPDCKLINPCQMFISDAEDYYVKRWPVFVDQKEIMIHSDSILTILDPKPDQIELYFKTIK
jgi:hypothetical protein